MVLNRKIIPRMIDISCVRADNTVKELEAMVDLAKECQFVCCFSLPCFTPWLVERLHDEKNVLVGAAIGFPSGAASTAGKLFEVAELKKAGCKEFDMVINIGALKSGLYDVVEEDIRAVVEAVGEFPLKTILEVALLTDDEIKRASEIAVRAGATFIKSGTGWADKPTVPEHIRLIKSVVGDSVYIKAAGGIRTVDDIVSLINEGCSRFGIGLKSIRNIMEELGDRSVECADVEILY